MTEVIKSAPKWHFLHVLGLDPQNQSHQAKYWLMKSEAIRTYNQQLDGNRAALKPEFARAPSPFAASQFTDAAFLAAIRTIEEQASPQTRLVYARGTLPNGSNWVIRWILYHVCRYRDGRNKAKAQSRKFHDDDDLDKGGPSSSAGGAGGAGGPGKFYDTARNEVRLAGKSR